MPLLLSWLRLLRMRTCMCELCLARIPGLLLHFLSSSCSCFSACSVVLCWCCRCCSSYVVAVGVDEAVDVSRRYVKDWADACSRRGEVSEAWLAAALAVLDAVQRSRACRGAGPHPARSALLRARQAAEAGQLAAHVAYDDGVRRAEEQGGRISGSLLWRAARRELGDPTAAKAAAGAGGGAAGGAGRAGGDAASASASADASWLRDDGYVVDGWALAQPSSPGATTASMTASGSTASASTASGSASTPAAAAAAAPASESVRSLTSFGALLLALAAGPEGRGQLVWRAAPPAVGDAAPAAAAPPPWKPMHVWTLPLPLPPAGAGAAGSPEGALTAWPPAETASSSASSSSSIVAVAAEPGTMRCYAILDSGSSLSVWHIEHQAIVPAGIPGSVPAAAAGGGLRGAASAVASAVVPAAPAAGSKAWLARPIAGSVLRLPAAASGTCPSPSAAVAAGRLWLLAAGRLWRSAALHGAEGKAAAEAEPFCFWSDVAAAPRCSDLCATSGAHAVLLALQAQADEPAAAAAPGEAAAGASDAAASTAPAHRGGATAGRSGSVVVLAGAPRSKEGAGADAVGRRGATVTVPLQLRNADGPSASALISVAVPSCFLDGSATPVRLAGLPESELSLTLSVGSSASTSSAPSGGAGHSSAAAAPAAALASCLQEGDWVTLAPVGQASQPSWQRSLPLWECAAFAADAPAGRPDEGAGARPSAVHGTWLPRIVAPDGQALAGLPSSSAGRTAVGAGATAASSMQQLCVPLQATPLPASTAAADDASNAAATAGFDPDAPFWRRCRLQLPTQPGVYELRLYRGAGYGTCVGVSAVPVLLLQPDGEGAVTAASAAAGVAAGGAGAGAGAGAAPAAAAASDPSTSSSAWVPLLPASHVAGLAIIGGRAAAPAGAAAASAQLCAVTSNGDVWTCRLPRPLQDRLHAAAQGLSFCLSDWALPQAAKGAGTSAAASAAAADSPVSVLAAQSLPPAARIQALFAQLTKGCSPGTGTGSCAHPHCASNPAVGPLAPKPAILRAAQLAHADGAFCPAFAAAFKPQASATGGGSASK